MEGEINMAMLLVICKDCGEESSLRGYIEKEDLRGTRYENLMDTITEEELNEYRVILSGSRNLKVFPGIFKNSWYSKNVS